MHSTAVADLHLRESDVHLLLSDAASDRDRADARPCSTLLAAVGSDKGGALALLRRGLPADVITAVPGLRAHGAWTVRYREHSGGTEAAQQQQQEEEQRHHAFLLLSCGGSSTMVLDSRGADMAELTDGVRLLRESSQPADRCTVLCTWRIRIPLCARLCMRCPRIRCDAADRHWRLACNANACMCRR